MWPRHAVGVDGEVDDAAVHRHEVADPERLGKHRAVHPPAALDQIVRSLAALCLPGDAGDHQVAAEGDPGPPDGLGRRDHRRHAALHVLDAMAVEPVALDARRPRVTRAAEHERVDVEVAVEHQTPAAPRSAERGDRLEAPGLHLLEVHVVAALLEVCRQEASDRRLVGGEAWDPDELPGEVDDLALVHLRQHALLHGRVHSIGSFPVWIGVSAGTIGRRRLRGGDPRARCSQKHAVGSGSRWVVALTRRRRQSV